MRVGFDATSLALRRSGIGRYTLELLHALAQHEPELELVLMSHVAPERDVELPGPVAPRRLAGPGFPLKIPWMQLMLPFELAFDRPDVCHYTNYHAPLISPVPSVVNLHDMSLILNPERHPRRRVLTVRPFLRVVARRASAIICLTESARQDALRVLDIDAARTHVVPAAPAEAFRPLTDEALLTAVAQRYGLRPGFLLFVGTIEPRKNLVRLVEAYARLRRDGFAEPLVISGGWGWRSSGLPRTIARLGLDKHVRLTGFVPDTDLAALFNLARSFVYPSLYEGFGLPIIEALACGTPTVTSDRGATAEVAGNAAVLCDPEDVGALADALRRTLVDETLRAKLRAAGLRRAADFSWTNAAHQTAAVYRAAMTGAA